MVCPVMEEIIADTLEKVLTQPAAPAPAPTGEDREDKSRYFVPNVLIPTQENRNQEQDRDDDR